MSTFRVELTLPAVADLKAIRSYIAADDPAVAAGVAQAIAAAIATLEELPNRGRPGRVTGTREMIIPGSPWIIVYEVVATQVVVLRVLHAARQRAE